MVKEQTPYRYEATCRECNDSYTATVLYSETPPEYGDYIPTADYIVPSYCPGCREKPGNSILLHRTVDLDDATLSRLGRIKRLFGRLDHPTDPTPSQPKQVDILLEQLAACDPDGDGFNEDLFSDHDGVAFYCAFRRLDDEHLAELCYRARQEYGVWIPEFVERGEEYLREREGDALGDAIYGRLPDPDADSVEDVREIRRSTDPDSEGDR